MNLDSQTYQNLKSMGYSDEDINSAMKEIEAEEKNLPKTPTSTVPAPTTHFSHKPDENLIRWQLDLSEIMERAEHILRGDKLKNENGNIIWTKPDKEEDQILNNHGIQEVMRILSMYVNRNTILSNYDEQTINTKVYDFGVELSNLFFMKYESFGWRAEIDPKKSKEENDIEIKKALEKRKNYYMLISEIRDLVHSAYLRALHGGERLSLRTARQVSQSESIMPHGVNVNVAQPMRERGIMNPLRLVAGRYK